jgi:DNA polymerase elongation subunit (family B)
MLPENWKDLSYAALSDDELKKLAAETRNRISRFKIIQTVRKVCLNSAYGAVGTEYFRYFDPRQAAAVTLSGQMVIRRIINHLNAYLNQSLKTKGVDYAMGADTDSVLLQLKAITDEVLRKGASEAKLVDIIDAYCKQRLEPQIQKICSQFHHDFNHAQDLLVMKREAIADRGVWTAKKRYILNVWDSEGVRFAKPELKMVGIEAVRSGTPVACREYIIKCLEIFLRGTEQELWDYVRQAHDKFVTLEFEDVARGTGIKGIEKYEQASQVTALEGDIEESEWKKGAPIHVKAAIVYNRMLRREGLSDKYPPITDYDKIKFTHIHTPNFFGHSVFAAPEGIPREWKDRIQIDYETQWQKGFVDPITAIISCGGWTTQPRVNLDCLFD